MAITVKMYGAGLKAALGGTVDLDTDTFKLTLHTSTYTPDRDVHDFYDDATNELSTASGYTSGGVTLTTLALTKDNTTHQVRWDFDDVSWTFTAAVTWRYGVIRKSRGGASSADELVALLDWATSQTVSTAYTVQLNANGLLYVDYT